MTVVVAALVGYFAGRLIWLGLKPSLNREPFLRTNYQGTSLPTAAGVVLALALLLVEAGRAIAGAVGVGSDPGITPERAAVAIAVLGFTIFGLLDDLTGRTDVRGLAGHLNALRRGQLTSGAVKLFGGAAVALVATATVTHASIGTLIEGALIVALTANLINLFDLRPGRATKVGLLAFVILAAATALSAQLVPVAIIAGAGAALLLDDLHEHLMLGDTGANALGAALGVGLATQLSPTGRAATLILLIVLTVASEFVSFSKVIDGFGPLRVLDHLGRRGQGQGSSSRASESAAKEVDLQGSAEETSSPAPWDDLRGTPPRSRATVESAPDPKSSDDAAPKATEPGSSGSGGPTGTKERNPFRPFEDDNDTEAIDLRYPRKTQRRTASTSPFRAPYDDQQNEDG